MTKEKITALRKELENQNLDGFIIPHDDEFGIENLPESSKRLEWLTGFTGSAGTAIVLKDKAALFVDGRYTLQAPKETDTSIFEIVGDKTPEEWIADNLGKNKVLSYDAMLHSSEDIKGLSSACENSRNKIKAVPKNLIDLIWKNRPSSPKGKIFPHPIEYSGVQSEYKRRKIASEMKKDNVKACFINDPSSVAWLLNIRGQDVDYEPVPLAFAVLHNDASVDLLIDKDKIDNETKKFLGDKVRICPMENLEHLLEKLSKSDKKVQVDAVSCPSKILDILHKNNALVKNDIDPCLLPKACKNNVEVEGAKKAQVRDGASLVKFLAWFDENAPKETLTELDAAKKLDEFRRQDDMCKGASFETIPATGANGAIVHYHAKPESCGLIKNGDIFLLDSGGQYPFGTTDVTRTISVGKSPSDEEKTRFTQVLKGLIAVSVAKFPEGTKGYQIDPLARQALWAEGLDYNHGTGHGVGSFLSVHEGPQGISKNSNKTALMSGMLLSNEPGYYEEGKFGIRLENIICVNEAKQASKPFLKNTLDFETLTLVPFDRSLIKTELLLDNEIEWINNYHSKVEKTLSPMLDNKTAEWLKKATKPIAKKNTKSLPIKNKTR